MKTINSILELLGVSALALLIFELTMYYIVDLWYRVGILSLGLILCIVLYILSSKYEKRLERELESNEERRKRLFSKILKLEQDLANQVKATDDANRIIENMKREIKHDEPFAEESQSKTEQHICVCGKEMRETAKMFVCDWCKKRVKKTNLDVLSEK